MRPTAAPRSAATLLCGLLVVLAGAGVSPLHAQDVVDVVGDSLLVMVSAGESLAFPYFCNRPFQEIHGDVERAVLVMHGTLRNADVYFNSMKEAADIAGAEERTLIIAPQFLTEEDVAFHELPDSMLYWEYYGWRQGDQSDSTAKHPRPWSISSYAIADTILMRLVSRCQFLQQIIVTGHSAGGQFTNRFAAGNQTHAIITGQRGVPIRYIVSNPSTSMYFNEERWMEASSYAFEIPVAGAILECPEYNGYKYGLENPNPYMSIGSELLRQQYAERNIIYLMGEFDTNPNSTYLDRSCPAMFMGRHRLERGIVYFHYMQHFYGPSILDLQELVIVPRVGHNHNAIYTSACGVAYLFEQGECVPVTQPSDRWHEITTPLLAAEATRAAAWGDYDGDAAPDLYLVGPGNSNRLLHNEGDGTFADSTVAPLADAGDGWSSAWIDVDDDGDADLYVINQDDPCRLFRNDGDAGFADITSGPLAGDTDLRDQGWADVDLDGDLDLYLSRTTGQANRLLRNDGEGVFVDATAAPLGGNGSTHGVAWGDHDCDGDPDLYLANNGPNRLLENDGSGVFTAATQGPLGVPADTYSAIWADIDNDADLDLYLTNRYMYNRLLRNDGHDGFMNISTFPLSDGGNSRSASWGDYDLDGDPDLYLVNDGSFNRLLRNDGWLGFVDDTFEPMGDPGTGYGASWADMDGDGDLDLYLTNNAGANRLVRNDGGYPHHWLQIGLTGDTSNTAGIGTRLWLESEGRRYYQEVGSGGSGCQAQSALTAVFGLGPRTHIDELAVLWPSGAFKHYQQLDIDQRIWLLEPIDPTGGEGSEVPPLAVRLHQSYPNPFNPRATIPFDLPLPAAVSLRIYDTAGRLVRVLRAGMVEAAGRRAAIWDGRDEVGEALPSGVYFYCLDAAGVRQTRRLTLVR